MTINPSGNVARVSSVQYVKKDLHLEEVNANVGLTYTDWGEANNIPEPEFGTLYIVSSIVGMCSRRTDIVSPNTSPQFVVRNTNGEIIGCRALQTFNRGMDDS